MSDTAAGFRSQKRRRRQEVRQQIVGVARRQLQVKPFRELTVDELMQPTGFTRTAFYRFFPDREAVLLDLLEEVWSGLAAARDIEAVGEDVPTAASMAELRGRLAESRAVLKGIADAAPGDEDVEESYRAGMHSYWINDITARIRAAQQGGLAGSLDPEVAGEALGWMAERMVTQSIERDPDEVLDTIISIISTCLYSGG